MTDDEQVIKEHSDVLSGARRVGKTTIMYQMIDNLIDEGISPKNILYVSFDNPIVKLVEAEKSSRCPLLDFSASATKVGPGTFVLPFERLTWYNALCATGFVLIL